MSTQKPQPKDKANEPERRDDLALDPEAVKDLESTDEAAEQVRAGGLNKYPNLVLKQG